MYTHARLIYTRVKYICMEMYREGKAQHSTAAWRTAPQAYSTTAPKGWAGRSTAATRRPRRSTGAQDLAGREVSWIQIIGKKK